MTVRMKYATYKAGYTEYPADDYIQKDKTIAVELPEYSKPKFPKEFGAGGYKVYKSVAIQCYNAGYAENYRIEQLLPPYKHTHIPCGLKAREQAIQAVYEFAAEIVRRYEA